MPGNKINRQQVRLYMQSRQEGKTQKTSSAKAGFSERSARNIEKRGFVPSSNPRTWNTRFDPFEEVWDSYLEPLLEKNPSLQAKTLLEDLQINFANKYPDNLLRTLQRRVQKWRAIKGPEKEIIFRQKHPPGWQGLSDFTCANKLQITILGEALLHLLYHYRLPYSGWEYVQVVLGGESFTALSEGLQNALWLSGGVPETHRTDSLSAAYKNCTNKEKEDFTQSYQELCDYYGMEPTRNNKGKSHENGSIESSHGHFKTRLDQALLLRNSREFSSIEEYKQFVHEVMTKRNLRIQKKHLEELQSLKELPKHKTHDFTEERASVTSCSTIRVRGVRYSVPSKLIGMTLKIHIYDDRLECFVGGDRIISLIRKRKRKGESQQIDYRHVIGSLIQKPQAFRNYVYKDALFPTFAFMRTWEELDQHLDDRNACREFVGILYISAKKSEAEVNTYLEDLLSQGKLPRLEQVKKHFIKKTSSIPEIEFICPDISSYDELLSMGGES